MIDVLYPIVWFAAGIGLTLVCVIFAGMRINADVRRENEESRIDELEPLSDEWSPPTPLWPPQPVRRVKR